MEANFIRYEYDVVKKNYLIFHFIVMCVFYRKISLLSELNDLIGTQLFVPLSIS